jgi:hypothetical protein
LTFPPLGKVENLTSDALFHLVGFCVDTSGFSFPGRLLTHFGNDCLGGGIAQLFAQHRNHERTIAFRDSGRLRNGHRTPEGRNLFIDIAAGRGSTSATCPGGLQVVKCADGDADHKNRRYTRAGSERRARSAIEQDCPH